MAKCFICSGGWTSGKALLDGSVFHESCYSALLTEVETLPRREEELLSELDIRRAFFESWKRWFVPARRRFAAASTNELANLYKDVRNRRYQLAEQLKHIYDVWPTYPPDWAERRKHTWRQNGPGCSRCGEITLLHLHHRRPIHEGGTHRIENLALLCEACHSDAHGGRRFRSRNEMPVEDNSHRALEVRIRRINEAIANGGDVGFQYSKRDGTVTKRTVTPREIRKLTIAELRALVGRYDSIQREGRLCMFGYCHLRGAGRTFAVDRIRNLRLLA
jgi:hypothetical protein